MRLLQRHTERHDDKPVLPQWISLHVATLAARMQNTAQRGAAKEWRDYALTACSMMPPPRQTSPS